MNKHKRQHMRNVLVHPPTTRTPLHRIPIAHSTPSHMTHENAQHMKHDRCVSICSVPLQQRLQTLLLQQTARCCLPNNMRPSWSAHQFARIAQPDPRNAQTAKSTCATDTDAYAKKKKPVSKEERPPTKGGRPAPPQRAGVRLRIASLFTAPTEVRAHP